MKLFNAIILFINVFTLAVAKPLNDSGSHNISTPAEQLVLYYDHEFDLWAQEICTKIENITQEILNDEVLQKTVAPLTQTFKKNLTEFQQYYPYLKRFGLNATVVSEFSDMMKGFYYPSRYENNTDFPYIQQLLKKFGYTEIRLQYTEKFSKFVSQKFLKKFEEFQTEIVNKSKDREHDLKVLKWVDCVKGCQDYECFLINFESYERMHAKFLDRIFGEVFRYIYKTIIIQADNTNIFAQAVLKDPKLAQLSAPLKQQLVKNLQNIIKILENVNEYKHIYYFLAIRYHVLYRFEDYASISAKERQLITNIFNDHQYESLQFGENKRELLQMDYIKRYETELAALSPNKLAQYNGFFEAIDRIINASDAHEKTEAWNNLDKRSSN